ncbi:type II toxin-antitoxin system VapC family toxin [Sandaracinus amylolyticus]|uniref:type II toxin-antitoxin system VapC family toxin n=1 Tax=Sandaracinus amylolyticus TaxID=927083 RepID=UPI00069D9FDB|nr:type II toxin-antitoxin system VapC family toxin [Sandaracinus amylolyticus]
MSSRVFLLDTSILLPIARGGPIASRLERSYGLRASGPTPLVSVVSEAELRVMADRNSWGPRKRAEIDRLFDELVVIDIGSPEVIDRYVALSRAADQARGGARQLSHNDLWIAASAAATSATLLTADADFDVFPAELISVQRIEPLK